LLAAGRISRKPYFKEFLAMTTAQDSQMDRLWQAQQTCHLKRRKVFLKKRKMS
jgi:hypothetical protein